MSYATGWEQVDWSAPDGPAGGPGYPGSDAMPLPQGPRHAVPAGSRTSVCDRTMAHVRDDLPFADGAVDAPPCSDCLALDRAAASVDRGGPLTEAAR